MTTSADVSGARTAGEGSQVHGRFQSAVDPLQEILSGCLSALYLAFAISTPLAVAASSPNSALRLELWQSNVFVFSSVSLVVLSLVSGLLRAPPFILLMKKAVRPDRLHANHILQLTVMMPLGLTLGFYYLTQLTIFRSNTTTLLLLALWFEGAYLFCFSFLVEIWSRFFELGYTFGARSSLSVAGALANRALRKFEGKSPIAANSNLRIAYEMVTRWLRAHQYECNTITRISESLLATDWLGDHLSEQYLKHVSSALSKLPNWRDVLSELLYVEVGSVTDHFTSIRYDPNRIFQTALAVLIALGTIITPVTTLLPSDIKKSIVELLPSSPIYGLGSIAVIALLLCYRYWSSSLATLIPGLTQLYQIMWEEIGWEAFVKQLRSLVR